MVEGVHCAEGVMIVNTIWISWEWGIPPRLSRSDHSRHPQSSSSSSSSSPSSFSSSSSSCTLHKVWDERPHYKQSSHSNTGKYLLVGTVLTQSNKSEERKKGKTFPCSCWSNCLSVCLCKKLRILFIFCIYLFSLGHTVTWFHTKFTVLQFSWYLCLFLCWDGRLVSLQNCRP